MRKRTGAALAALAIIGSIPFTASPSAASDWGGDGSPTNCSNAYTVKSKAIYGSRGALKGKVIGSVQLRWSWGCHGNWSRVVLYGGMYSNRVTVEQQVRSEGRAAGANDSVVPGSAGASAWTPYLRLKNSASRACAQAWVSSDFGTLNFHTNGAEVCA